MSNLAAAQAIYEAFGRGDIQFILEQVADDIRWDQREWPGPAHGGAVPTLVPRAGKAGVGEFFAALAGLEFHGFTLTNLLEGANQVAAIVELDATVKATGTRVQDTEVHLMTFNDDGKIVELRHILDTAKALDAYGH